MHINYPIVAFAVALFCILLNYPIFENFAAQKAFALMITVAVLWISEALPLSMTALAIPVAASLCGLASPRESFGEFSHPILFLFMGGFVLAGALSKHQLDSMLARRLITAAKGNFYWSAIFLMLATSLTACWVGNTSATAMMLPLALGILVLANKKTVSAESKFLVLGIAYSANIGGIITMVASPPNAIGAAILGLSFSEWTRYTLPLFLITFPIMAGLLTMYFKPNRTLSIAAVGTQQKVSPNKTLIAIFFITVIFWSLDGVLSPLFNIENGFNSLVALLAVFAIFMTKVLTWEEIMTSVKWEVLLLFGGGLTLGMLIDKSGLGTLMIHHISGLLDVIPLFLFLWMVVAASIIMTEFMSNTASAALLLPLLFTMANGLHINPLILVFPATIAASYGFMLPVGTPPNAMVFSSGFIPQKDMIKAGFALNLILSLILTSFFYFILD